jgi:membrane protein implicated in regulation of membrane protease activity
METISQLTLSMYFFWIALAAAALMSVSLIFGHDHDFDHDLDHDVEHDLGHDLENGESGNMSILSMKVLLMFATGFGCGGFFGARAGYHVLGSSFWGLGAGLLMAATGYFVMNYLYRHQGNSTVRTSQVLGQITVVDTAIAPGGFGLVRCVVEGHAEYFQARSKSGLVIPSSSRVKVVEATGALLTVEPAE